MGFNTAAGWGTIINQVDAFRVNNSFSGNVNPITNFERVDSDSYLKIGDGMGLSGGTFSFPKTGVWLITCIGSFAVSGNGVSRYNGVEMMQTTDNSSYGNCARFYANLGTNYSTGYTNGICQHIFDVQNISNYKIRFKTEVANSNVIFDASTSHNQNLFTFIRLGDT